MDEKIDTEKYTDDFMLPGFRFHPTDEELVGFYLRRKLQQRSLPIELIKQLDIYKHDPWDLPKYASTGEKEWYFYCPRDRKYRNSTRPNRVTGSGFWKATGTDRPIYSSDGAKCIGLKKSLVFYRGRAAKGIKTDWMMHEFRLPSSTDAPPPPKRIIDKGLPATDSWAICRIFKKTNSLAHRALSHSWAASLSETTSSPDAFTYSINQSQFNSGNITENDLQNSNFPSLNMPPYKAMFSKPHVFASSQGDYFPENFILSPRQEVSGTTNKSTNTTTTTVDLTSMLFNVSPAYDGPQMNHNGFSSFSSQVMQGEDEQEGLRKRENVIVHNPWGNIRSMGFPFSLPSAAPSHMPWDSPPACPSEISSTTYSTDKCYT